MQLRVALAAVLIGGALLTSACSGSQGSLPAGSLANAAVVPAVPNAVQNGNFTTGKLAPWKTVGTNPGMAVISTKEHYTGSKYSAFMGTTKPPAVKGLHGIYQSIKVPADGKLTFWYMGASNDEIKYGDQEVDVQVGGKIVDTCYKALTNDKSWKLGSCNLKKYANQTVDLVFGVYDNGYSKTFVNWYIGGITLN